MDSPLQNNKGAGDAAASCVQLFIYLMTFSVASTLDIVCFLNSQ
jgi:hypothetical protein